jgi:hypothetical protein
VQDFVGIENFGDRHHNLEIPTMLSASGAGTATAGPWAWETADVLSLQRDGEAINAEIRKIHELFKNGNAVELLNKMRTFIKESALAYPCLGYKGNRSNANAGYLSKFRTYGLNRRFGSAALLSQAVRG